MTKVVVESTVMVTNRLTIKAFYFYLFYILYGITEEEWIELNVLNKNGEVRTWYLDSPLLHQTKPMIN